MDSRAGPNHVGYRLQCLRRGCRIERFGAKGRQSIDFLSAQLGGPRLFLRAIQELGSDDARHEEREQHQPIERIGDDERVVRWQKQHVEYDE